MGVEQGYLRNTLWSDVKDRFFGHQTTVLTCANADQFVYRYVSQQRMIARSFNARPRNHLPVYRENGISSRRFDSFALSAENEFDF